MSRRRWFVPGRLSTAHCVLAVMLIAGLAKAAPLFPADSPVDRLGFEIKAGASGAPELANAAQLSDPIPVKTATVPMEVHCSTGVDCHKIGATLTGQPVVITAADAASASAQLKLASTDSDLLLSFDGKQLLMRKLTQAGAGPKISEILVGSATEIGKNALVQPVHLGDWLTLRIDGLAKLGEKAATAKKPLQLFLNGLPLAGVPPVYLAPDDTALDSRIRFEMKRTDDSDSKVTWAALLGKPQTAAGQRKTEVSVGVAGCAEGCSDMTGAVPINLVVLRTAWLAIYVLGLVAFAWVLLRLAKRTSLLHDRGRTSSWSLGRTQMAWWFFFVVAAFMFIWMVTGSYSSLSPSVLALIGISGGTALTGAVMDDSKQSQIAQRPVLEAERQQLAAATALLAPGDPAVQSNNQRLKDLAAQLEQLPVEQKSERFSKDILRDENGVSFHRFQIVIWTIVLTVIFVSRVYVQLAMPDFDNQLLALMGISSGTYLGFKFPEKQA
jgi:hypothetical protein